jgi:uncharacterized cupredoxin-like copper-binding protein
MLFSGHNHSITKKFKAYMKKSEPFSFNHSLKSSALKSTCAVIIILFMASCTQSNEQSDASASESPEMSQAHQSMEASQYVAEYAALDYVFAGPSEIPSGWITFRMPNQGEEHHVMILIKLPEGVSYSEYNAAIQQRRSNGETPEWWNEWIVMGGPAALGPGLVGETTVKLDPGEYVMVCPVPTADGTQHSALGMMRPLTVTEEESGAMEPKADITMTLRSLEFELDKVITPGRHTIGVRFENQPEGKPHDVHVARLGEDQTIEDFAASMQGDIEFGDFFFIGGAEDMPEGHTAYFTADFEPGRYAFWCHSHSEDGMVQEFTIEPLN